MLLFILMDQTSSNPLNESPDQRDVRENKDIAAFSYIWIMSVVILVARKESAFVRFHAKQGTALFLISIFLPFIPFIGKLLMLVVVAGMLIGFINAAQGKKADVPLIGKLSRGELTMGDLRELWSTVMKAIGNFFHSSASKSPATPQSVQVDNMPKPPVP